MCAKNLLQFHSARPTVSGLEMHLVRMHKMIEQFEPTTVIVDPVFQICKAPAIWMIQRAC